MLHSVIQRFVRFCYPAILLLARAFVGVFFRFRAFNVESLKTPGPALLVPNHVSWLDWLFLGVVLDEDWKFVVSSKVAESNWLCRLMMLNRRTFPVDTTSAYAVRHMADYLKQNGRLVLFAEGRISETGALMKLFDGTGFLLFKTRAKLITSYLRGADRLSWGLTRRKGWKRLFPQVTAHFGDALDPPHSDFGSTHQARMKLTHWLRDRMVQQQFEVECEAAPPSLLETIVESAANNSRGVFLEDVTGLKLTGRDLLIRTDLVARRLRGVLLPDAPRVGVLLPNVNATPVVILSLLSLGRVPAILNFSTGAALMLKCAELAELRQIISSKDFIEKAKLDIQPLIDAGIEFCWLDEIRDEVTLSEKLLSLCRVDLNPRNVVRVATKREDTAVILFTSGSEGIPKGVELTNDNLISNIRQALSILDVTDDERIFNALPIFHSFGLTIGTLFGLVRGVYVFLYPSPLHYRIVPNAIYDRQCTIFISTNTFLKGYARRAHPYDFRSVRLLWSGAEKLQEGNAKIWSERFGCRILEGYGATECSPIVCVDIPMQPKVGSVGRLMPGMEWKLEAVPGVEEAGRLFVRGPNIMRGYLNPDANAAFLELGGWYDTGDIVHVDDDGYVFIRGRMKRFAKISGEMVSLTAVEDALSGAFPKYGLRCHVAILAIPDKRKGEALVLVSTEKRLTVKEARDVIREKGLPNLAAPRAIVFAREIPKLGTGKVNHRELQIRLADELAKL
jgi:acyl-[acyl-carrier-protein]-phospholipid O-acyltransferase/long-chain-fatty-acid--[acyl-carrier-protein] ligase